MPRTRSLAWAELKIGIVSVVALALAATLIFMLSGEGGFSWQRYSLKTVFDDIAGLNEGSPVRVAGVEAGSVTDLRFIGDRVEGAFEPAARLRPRGAGGRRIGEGGYVPSGRAAGSLTDVTRQASEGIGALTALLQETRTGRGTVGRLFTDEGLYTEMNALVSAAESVVQNINRGRGALGRLLN